MVFFHQIKLLPLPIKKGGEEKKKGRGKLFFHRI